MIVLFKKSKAIFRVLQTLLVVIFLAACSDGPQEPQNLNIEADVILMDAKVYSFAWDAPSREGQPAANAPFANGIWSPDAQAVAIKDGIILALGTNEEMQEFVGDNTQVFALAGASVMPGFVDTHTHINELGATLDVVDLKGVESEEEAVSRVEDHVLLNNIPEGQWIVARGWDEGL